MFRESIPSTYVQETFFEVPCEVPRGDSNEIIDWAEVIDWRSIDQLVATRFVKGIRDGRPALPARLMIGLLILKYYENLSDRRTIAKVLSAPAWQYLCGFPQGLDGAPCDASALARWRIRLGLDMLFQVVSMAVGAGVDAGILPQEKLEAVTDALPQAYRVRRPREVNLLADIHVELLDHAKRLGLHLHRTYRWGVKACQKEYLAIVRRKRTAKSKKAKALYTQIVLALRAVVKNLDRIAPQVGDEPLTETLGRAHALLAQSEVSQTEDDSFF